MEQNQNICRICNTLSPKVHSGFKGYIEGHKYDLYSCPNCKTSFVSPMEASDNLYEFIYSNSEKLVGYERYFRYSKLVKMFNKPLKFLSTTESSYWAVISEIEKNKNKPQSISILEVGSGLGYLTYALNKQGYSCEGIDISDSAVQEAELNYGKYFSNKNLFSLTQDKEKYDFVVMMDVIEHVENPVDFVRAALAVLKKDGKLLVTTPNKSSAPKENSLWQSDAPPVHLWFMAEETMEVIAKQMNCCCKLTDFTNFNNTYKNIPYSDDINKIQLSIPRLDKNGIPYEHAVVSSRKTIFLGLKLRYILGYLRRRIGKKYISDKSTTMCAVFVKN